MFGLLVHLDTVWAMFRGHSRRSKFTVTVHEEKSIAKVVGATLSAGFLVYWTACCQKSVHL